MNILVERILEFSIDLINFFNIGFTLVVQVVKFDLILTEIIGDLSPKLFKLLSRQVFNPFLTWVLIQEMFFGQALFELPQQDDIVFHQIVAEH